jgi:hypothetical protein
MFRRQETAPLLVNEERNDSLDEQDRELLEQESRKQVRRVSWNYPLISSLLDPDA